MKAESYIKVISVQDYLDKYCDIKLFQDKCTLCPVYGESWSCPPFDFDALEYWHRFKSVIIVCRKLIMSDKDKADYRRSVRNSFRDDEPSPDDHISKSGMKAVKGEVRNGGDGDDFNINKLLDGSIAGISEQLVNMEKLYEGSHALLPGRCDICGDGNCTRLKRKPCRFPERMHHTIESMGGDVGKTITEMFGIEMLWIKNDELPDYFIQMGALLIKE